MTISRFDASMFSGVYWVKLLFGAVGNWSANSVHESCMDLDIDSSNTCIRSLKTKSLLREPYIPRSHRSMAHHPQRNPNHNPDETAPVHESALPRAIRRAGSSRTILFEILDELLKCVLLGWRSSFSFRFFFFILSP
jgi:hypothetical protein